MRFPPQLCRSIFFSGIDSGDSWRHDPGVWKTEIRIDYLVTRISLCGRNDCRSSCRIFHDPFYAELCKAQKISYFFCLLFYHGNYCARLSFCLVRRHVR